ncbi:MAG TPA: hypothetical protein VFN88_02350 [Caulobacteraceae bacterium]|nr:hypothetical protein [Caulobacteraceae bacterium]
MLRQRLFAGLAACALIATAPLALAQEPTTAEKAAASAQMPRAKVKAGYKAPRAADGHAELEGIWTNATATRLERPASYGDKLLMDPAEAAKQEKATFDRNARINAPTAKETQENWKELAKGPDKLDECRGGSLGTACGYNAGWTDPGDLIMRVDGQPRTSLITFPANGRMPPRVAGAPSPRQFVESSEAGPERVRPGQNDNPEGRSLGERCIMSFGISSGPVMTPQLYNNTYKIVQTKDTVGIWVEMVHDMRLVRLNAQHRTDGVTPWMGDSIGWWDGDTLVVETTGFNPKQNLRGGDKNLKVTERFTRVAGERLHYAFKVEDPTVWQTAWGGEYEFGATNGIYEYACHEGNYGLEGILAGARNDEREAALGKTQAAK